MTGPHFWTTIRGVRSTAGWIAAWAILVAGPGAGRAQTEDQAEDSRAPLAEADDTIARGHFLRGQASFDAGDYAVALQEFERAFELSERPVLLYNIATSADRLRRTDRAIEAFEAYLDALPGADNRGQVIARLEVLREARARELSLQSRQEEQQRTHRRNVMLGVVAGVIGAGVLALTLGLTLRDRPPPYEQGDHGVVFALERP